MPPLIGRNLEFIGRVQSISLLERYKMLFGDLLMYQKILDNAIKKALWRLEPEVLLYVKLRNSYRKRNRKQMFKFAVEVALKNNKT